MKICPHCAEEIQDAAIKCRYCGEQLAGQISAPQPDENAAVRSPQPASRTPSALPPLFWLFELMGIAWFIFLATQSGWKAGVSAVVFAIAAPFAWMIGNLLRTFAQPSAYFASGMKDLIIKRLFWMVGPQSFGVLIVVVALTFWVDNSLGGLLRQTSPRSVTATPEVGPEESFSTLSQESDFSAAGETKATVADSVIEPQATEFEPSYDRPQNSGEADDDSSNHENIQTYTSDQTEDHSGPPDRIEPQNLQTYYAVIEVEGGRYQYIEVQAHSVQRAREVIRDFHGDPPIIEEPKIRD
jgi:hypothetical protein